MVAKTRRDAHLIEVERTLKAKFGRAMLASAIEGHGLRVVVDAADLVPFARFITKDKKLRFDYLSFIAGVDWPDRLEVVYHLSSSVDASQLTLKVSTSKEDPVVPSVTSVWPAADWHERETHDMFGIVFDGHPDLRPLLMPPESTLHPLRKEFGLSGEPIAEETQETEEQDGTK